MRYVALLRGINVGAGPRVPMAALKGLLESLGLTRVTTYLNSGNVVFDSTLSAEELAPLLESELEKAFGAPVPTLVKSAAEMVRIAESIPCEWGNTEREQTYVAYLFPEVDEAGLIDELPIKREFMTIYYTPGAFVWNIARENYNRSRITKIAGHPSYARMTTRNVNTARKLAEMAQARP